MNFVENYLLLADENVAAQTLSYLFGTKLNEKNKAINNFSNLVSKKISDLEIKKHLNNKLPLLVKYDLFYDEAGIVVSPEDAILIIEDLLYLEILFEEIKLKNGRRLQFLASFKNTSVEFLLFAINFLFCKLNGYEISELLSYSLSLKKFELNYLISESESERFLLYKKLIYRKRKCIFLDEEFIGFDHFNKINSIDDMLNLVFDEVSWLSGFFINKNGLYFDKYKNVEITSIFPKLKEAIKNLTTKESVKKIQTIDEVTSCLSILELTSMPKNIKELKKAFYRLAQKTHPDKFEHLAKGKQTEILIVDNFRRVQSAYEFIEAKLKE